MTTSSMLHATLAILIGTNLIVCIKTDADANSVGNSKQTEINVEPLSSKDFSPNLRELLSPDVFTQADPFHYLLGKAMKFSFKNSLDGHSLISELRYALLPNEQNRFPPNYLPYAEFLSSSLLPFIVYLGSVHKEIVENQKRRKINPYLPLPDINSLDPEISQFFSSDIFSDTNAPMMLVDKLLNLPENSFTRVAKKLNNAAYNDRVIGNYYYYYAMRLEYLLTGVVSRTALVNLQRYVGRRNPNGQITVPLAVSMSKLK